VRFGIHFLRRECAILRDASTRRQQAEYYPGGLLAANNFCFSSDLYPGGGYIFNYKTSGLNGSYSLNFTVSADTPGASHIAGFQVK
jgi:hypothetical protein